MECDCAPLVSARVTGAARGYVDSGSGRATGGSFATYALETAAADGAVAAVHRRYSDFEALSAYYERRHPLAVLPPVPEKNAAFTLQRLSAAVLGGEQADVQPGIAQSHALVEYRVRAFSRFLALVLAHPALRSDHVTHVFLTDADPSAFRALSLFTQAAVPASKTTPRVGRLTDAVLAELHGRVLPSLEDSVRVFETQQRAALEHSRELASSTGDLGGEYAAFALEHATLAPDLESLSERLAAEGALMARAASHAQLRTELARDALLLLPAVRRALKAILSLHTDYDNAVERVNVARSEIVAQAALAGSSLIEELEAVEDALRLQLVAAKDAFLLQMRVWLSLYGALWASALRRDVSSTVASCDSSIALWTLQ